MKCYVDMWCYQGKSVGTWTCDIFSFLFDWSAHLERYILLKIPLDRSSGPKIIEGFSEQWKTKEINSFFWLYLTINAPDNPSDPARSQHTMMPHAWWCPVDDVSCYWFNLHIQCSTPWTYPVPKWCCHPLTDSVLHYFTLTHAGCQASYLNFLSH